MRWTDDAIVLRKKRLGEYDGLVTLLTKEHGKCSAVVKNVYAKRLRSSVERGNIVHVYYVSRTQDQLGTCTIELLSNVSAKLLCHSGKLVALECACNLLERSIAYGQYIEHMFTVFKSLLVTLESDKWADSYCRWEITLLGELGMPLDFSCCAATGSVENLLYVSPKSGRAVSGQAGLPYKNKLLPFPHFLQEKKSTLTGREVCDSLQLSGYFLQRAFAQHGVRKIPEIRHRLAIWFAHRQDKIV